MLRKLPQKEASSLDLCGAQNVEKGMEGLQGGHSNVFPLSLSLLPMLLCEYLQIHGSLLATELDPFLTPLSSGHLFCFSSSSLRLLYCLPSYLPRIPHISLPCCLAFWPKWPLARSNFSFSVSLDVASAFIITCLSVLSASAVGNFFSAHEDAFGTQGFLLPDMRQLWGPRDPLKWLEFGLLSPGWGCTHLKSMQS